VKDDIAEYKNAFLLVVTTFAIWNFTEVLLIIMGISIQ